MFDLRRPLALVPAAFLVLFAISPRLYAQASPNSQPAALQAIRQAIDAELENNRSDKSMWMYDDEDDSGGKRALYRTIETRQGSLRRMIKLNGQPLSPAAAQVETDRIHKFVTDTSEQNKARKAGSHDDAQAETSLRSFPEAFIWTVVSETPELITLNFAPNPDFIPPDYVARVMSAMAGQVVIARDAHRIRTLKGALTHEVRFGYGLFGKMNQGGTIDIEHRQVVTGHWQITESHVHIGGHALLFATIGQQSDEDKTDWRPSPAETLAEAERVLNSPR